MPAGIAHDSPCAPSSSAPLAPPSRPFLAPLPPPRPSLALAPSAGGARKRARRKPEKAAQEAGAKRRKGCGRSKSDNIRPGHHAPLNAARLRGRLRAGRRRAPRHHHWPDARVLIHRSGRSRPVRGRSTSRAADHGRHRAPLRGPARRSAAAPPAGVPVAGRLGTVAGSVALVGTGHRRYAGIAGNGAPAARGLGARAGKRSGVPTSTARGQRCAPTLRPFFVRAPLPSPRAPCRRRKDESEARTAEPGARTRRRGARTFRRGRTRHRRTRHHRTRHRRRPARPQRPWFATAAAASAAASGSRYSPPAFTGLSSSSSS
jgi:hypothetical protein